MENNFSVYNWLKTRLIHKYLFFGQHDKLPKISTLNLKMITFHLKNSQAVDTFRLQCFNLIFKQNSNNYSQSQITFSLLIYKSYIHLNSILY